MPKRRMTAARKRQIRQWSLSGQRARSTSNPIPHGKSWPRPQKGSFGTVRRHKLGGKAYQKKTGSGFKPAAEAQSILAGTQGFRNPRVSAMESRAAMGTGPRVPKPEWYAKKLSPSEVHGSGTGLTSAYRYGPANPANKRKKGKK